MEVREVDIGKLSQGNVSEMKAFTLQYYSLFFNFAFKYIGNEFVSEDVTQESFVSFWENRANFRDIHSAKAYLYKLIKNKSLNYLRHLKVKENHQAGIKEHIEQVRRERNFVESIIKNESEYYVRRAILELSQMGQKVITLSMQGLSNEEIADELKISITTVKTHKQRTYQTLRKKLSFLRLFQFFITSF